MKTTTDTNTNAENTGTPHECLQETRICLIEKDVDHLQDSDTETKGILKELNKTMTDTRMVMQKLQNFMENKEKEPLNIQKTITNGIIIGITVGMVLYIVQGLIHIL